MKTLIKKSILLTLLMILVGVLFKANAQPHLCEDPCPPGPLKWDTITLCTAICTPDQILELLFLYGLAIACETAME